MRVSDSEIEQLGREGFVVVPGFLTGEELGAARGNLLRYFPTAEELAATPERYGELLEEADAGQREFPFVGDALNEVATHPEIVSMVEKLLGTSDVLLSQSAIWAKYGGAADYEQGLHLDYQGNTLVVPRDEGDFRQVNMILYYTDVTEELGPTMVVSQERTKGMELWPAFKTRKKHPELYKLERPILAEAGTLLIFSMRTFHRASDVSAEFGERFSHHLVYRSGKHNFQGYHLWAKHGENEELQRFIERSTVRQREVLGFPRVGDAYWNEETVRAVGLRYPGMDMGVYGRVG
jgi:hypothetical protein